MPLPETPRYLEIVTCFSFSAAVLLSLAFLSLSFRRREERVNLPTALIFLASALYAFGEYMMMTSGTFGLKVFWQRFEYAGVAFLITFYPWSVMAYTRTKIPLFFWFAGPLLSLGSAVLFFSSGLLVTDSAYLYSGYLPQGREGPLFPYFCGILFATIVYGMGILLRSHRRRSGDKDWPLILGSAIALAAGVFDALRIFLPVRIMFGSVFVIGIIAMDFLYSYTIFTRFIGLYSTIDENERTIRGLLHISRREFLDLLSILLQVIDAKDHYTAGHSLRVSEYSLALAREIGLESAEMQRLKTASLLHDIGKIGVSEQVLNKPGKLTADEFGAIKTHCDIGVSILQNIEDFTVILEYVRCHHERMDGKGYPLGLKDGMIPLASRIIAVADTYDALTSNRPYRTGLSREEAIRIIGEAASPQLDSLLVEKFILVLRAEQNLTASRIA